MFFAFVANLSAAGIFITDNVIQPEAIEQTEKVETSDTTVDTTMQNPKEHHVVVIFMGVLTVISTIMLYQFGDVWFTGAIMWGNFVYINI
jgi:hypothetical protein